MARTRSNRRQKTPEYQIENREANTIEKSRFYDAYDAADGKLSQREFAKQHGIPRSTVQSWLTQRSILGSPLARRHTRRLHAALGRPSKLSPEKCKALVDPKQNEHRTDRLEIQLEREGINLSERAAQVQIHKHTNNGRFYKMAYIKKNNKRNFPERREYGRERAGKPIRGYFNRIMYTDEAHVDPSAMAPVYILREEGTRYDDANIDYRPPFSGNKIHMASWVTYDRKGPLKFYNDEPAQTIEPPKPTTRRPRKRKAETDEEFEHRILVWQASKGHEKVTKTAGNSMTQIYYVDNILPLYCEAIEELRAEFGHDFFLQEDGDGSHGKKTYGLAQEKRDEHQIISFYHPAGSPDVSPIEACWNILKNRFRRVHWEHQPSVEEMQHKLEELWEAITQEEIQARFDELPDRMQRLVDNRGRMIRSKLW